MLFLLRQVNMLTVTIVSLSLFHFIETYPVQNAESKIISTTPQASRIEITATMIIAICLATAVIVFIVIICGKCIYSCIRQQSPVHNSSYEAISSGGERSGPSGLLNTNETCYMNSMIQAIASSELLIKEYVELISKSDEYNRCDLLKLFVDLLKNINDINNDRYYVQRNTDALKRLMIHSNWTGQSQQDSFHLLSTVINAVQQDMKEILNIEKKLMPPKINMLHAFTENSSFNRVQHHLALALPLCGNFRDPRGVKLETLIESFFMASQIEDSTNATQMFLFEKIPSILIIHIQANEWDVGKGAFIKPKYYIKFGEMLTYTFNVQMKVDGTKLCKVFATFRLTAVVDHMGGATGGHYVTYRMHNEQWYLTNDTQVARATLTSNIIPYIMVYEKVFEEEIIDDLL